MPNITQEIGGVTLNWPLQFKLIYKITNEVRLQYFQFKLLADIVVTDKKLKLYGVREHDRCSFCDLETGTVKHMYIECTKVIPIYKETLSIHNKYSEEKLDINRTMMLFLDETQLKTRMRLNVLLLWTRYYIYQTFIHKDKLSCIALKHSLKSRLHMLKIICKQEGKQEWLNGFGENLKPGWKKNR